jgi:dipeptidyl aminopeptidase/acylaminoacyl peptidase
MLNLLSPARTESQRRAATLWRGVLAAALLTTGVVLPAATYAGDEASGADLIARKLLFGNPERANIQISPDGRQISYLAPKDGVLNVWVAPVDKLDAARCVTNDKHRGIRQYFWTFTNCHVVYLQDRDGDENWRAYSVDLASNTEKDLTPAKGVQARIEAISHKFPTEILLALNDRDAKLHDLYRVNLQTGERKLVCENKESDSFNEFVVDQDYTVRFATKARPDGGSEIFQMTADGWKNFATIEQVDSFTTQPFGVDKSGKTLFMVDSRGRNTAAMTAVDLATNKATILAEDARCDAGEPFIQPVERTVQAVKFGYERSTWKVLDKSIEADFAALANVADGDFDVVSRTLDDKTWIVTYVVDNGPARTYRYDRGTKQAQFLFTNRPALEGKPLARMHPVIIKSRDGKELVSYLTLPTGSDADHNARPDQPLPMVLVVHGGPWGRDSWGFNALHQWLANRGYAVLSVNFRGSTGFGKSFTNAGDHQWAGKMHEDLLDAVDWAIADKIADGRKVAIMGGSYGGYATLVGVTFTPEKFACGVDIVGPSNLVTLLESVPPYWKPMLDMMVARVGDHRTDEGRKFLTERSPLTLVDRICRPLLIGQGANDPRVKQAESDQIVRAMQEKRIPVTYALFGDEGHGFRRPENSVAFWAVAEAFLSQHLGGRYEPIGKDFEGSTIKFPAGSDQIPGLAQALQAH